MILKTKALVVFLIISVFLLSSCEVYQTLYGNQAETENTVPDTTGMVTTDVEDTTDGMEDMQEDEVMEAPEDLTSDEVAEEETTEEETASEEETFVEEEVQMPVSSSDEKPIVLVVEETEQVSLVPQAEDPDSDTSLMFTFTSPLDDDGQWQTTYGDNGEYTVTITASDGELTTTKDVLIIVGKKEESPQIDSSFPQDNALAVDETAVVDFSASASDLNNDPLEYEWKLDGIAVGNEESYSYQTTYDDAGTHTVKVDVQDGTSAASKIWSIDVRNVNREPVMESLDDISARETDTITITVLASDDDNDNIEYSISSDRFQQDGNVFTWQTDYTSAGTYDVTVSASDGQDTTEQTITVAVQNVNRPPVITDIVQKK